MSRASHLASLLSAIVLLGGEGAAASAHGAPAIPHMLVKYRPGALSPCFDTAPIDAGVIAATHLPAETCKAPRQGTHMEAAIARN